MSPQADRRPLAWLPLLSFGVCALLCTAALFFLFRAWETPKLSTEFGVKGYSVAFALVLGGLGALIATRRPSNAIGWIFCALGLMSAVMALGTEFARWTLIQESNSSTGGLYSAWLQEWIWIPLIGGLGLVSAIFPDGRFTSRRWRNAMVVALALALVPTILNALIPRFTIFVGYGNPLGFGGRLTTAIAPPSVILILPLIAGGAAAALLRFRRSHGEERQQLKWLVFAASVFASLMAYYGTMVAITGSGSPSLLPDTEYLTVLALLGVPISITFGVLKYRLYDIDIVIRRTVVYAILAVLIVGVGIWVVMLARFIAWQTFGENTSALFLAGLAVGVVFLPLRNLATRIAGRLVFGGRATPYEVLSNLSDQLAGASSLEDVLPETARLIVENTGAQRAAIWISEGGGRRVAGWPPDATSEGDEQVFPVVHQSERIGDVRVLASAREPLTDPQRKLITEVASQAGLVLRNVALIEDLRASRQRLVAAQDEERRKIERNLHDGAQQQLIALGIKVNLAKGLASKDADKATKILEGVQGDLQDSIDTLRDLARGIYPPLLADQGLAAALEAQSRKAAVPTTVDGDGIGRFPQEIEAAAYFCCLEALQNISKYANATQVTIALSSADAALTFGVTDDGDGFDITSTNYGTGMQGMADRLDAIGGSLKVESTPGAGTTVTGTVPIGSDR